MKILSALILMLVATGSFAQKAFKPAFSTVLDTSLALQILHQCSRSDPDKIEQYWKISEQDVKNLEENFEKIYQLQSTGCCLSGPKLQQLKKFGYQYIGVTINGRRCIYINAFPIGDVKQYKDSGHDPSREPVAVCDGGASFWGALFDLESKQFSALSFNGEG